MDRNECINRLKAAWAAYPNLRFGQFLIDVMSAEGSDLFYVNDEQLVAAAEKWVRLEHGENP